MNWATNKLLRALAVCQINRHRTTALSSRINQADGFTLFEVMVSMFLFLTVSASMATTFVAHLKHNTDADHITAATNVAIQKLDALRFENPTTLPTSGVVGPETYAVGGRDYQVYTTYCPISTYCASGNNRHLKVEVHYRGKILYHVETVYTQLR